MADKYGLDIPQLEGSLEPSANTIGLIRVLLNLGVLKEEHMKDLTEETNKASKSLMDVTLGTIAAGVIASGDVDENEVEEFADYYGYSCWQELRERAVHALNTLPVRNTGDVNFDKLIAILAGDVES